MQATLKTIREANIRSTKTLAAIDRAIAKHGEDAAANMCRGWVSTRKGSNCYNAAQEINASEYAIFAGGRAGRNANDGYRCIIVKVA